MLFTIDHEADIEMVVQKSRFIAHVRRASTRDEAEAVIKGIRESFSDATHNVPCYVIGKSQEEAWSSEDGEPQGTSGAPVLKMLLAEGYTDIVLVTTRYFGGIKLGTGGLVRAYTDAAKMVLEEAGKKTFVEEVSVRVSCDYGIYDLIASRTFDIPVKISDQEYADRVGFTVTVKKVDLDYIKQELTDISGGRIEISAADQQ